MMEKLLHHKNEQTLIAQAFPSFITFACQLKLFYHRRIASLQLSESDQLRVELITCSLLIVVLSAYFRLSRANALNDVLEFLQKLLFRVNGCHGSVREGNKQKMFRAHSSGNSITQHKNTGILLRVIVVY